MCEIDQSDCCGNGCANCILDSTPISTKTARTVIASKINILHTYRKYKLIQKSNLLPHLIQMKFVIADDKKQLTEFILDCPPGHHLMMRALILGVAGNTDNKTILRPYSPFWTDMTEFEFEILVNLKPNGIMTKYINSLQLDDEAEFRGPIGVFVYEPSVMATNGLVIFSQGVAIAPTIPIVETIIRNEEDMNRILHFSCFQNIESIIFRDKLMEFNKFWNFSSKVYLSQQSCEKCVSYSNCEHFRKQLKYKEQIHSKRLSAEIICTHLKDSKTRTVQFVICGSNSFQEFIKDSLVKCNVNKNCVFVL